MNDSLNKSRLLYAFPDRERAHQCMAKVYEERREIIAQLQLRNLLARANLYRLCLGTQSAAEIVSDLLNDRMGERDEAILQDYFLRFPVLSLELMQQIQNDEVQDRILYEDERAKAVNRFTREFLQEFSRDDGGIDWEKLLRFNSGA